MLLDMSSKLPSPPLEEAGKAIVTKKGPLRTTKPANRSVLGHRVAKRASHSAAHSHHQHQPLSPPASSPPHSIAEGARHKRVWKACERCRMKKTKCDGEFPCKRCKDDGLICTAGKRRKTDFKQLPHGYAEVLENTQFALVATVQKLYSMVRSGQSWELGEPDLNDRAQPVIHSIADKLGCIRPNNDIDLPVHSVFPEDDRGFAELASQLEAQQHQEGWRRIASDASHDRASPDELDISDPEDYRAASFSHAGNALSLSTHSMNRNSFDSYSQSDGLSSATSPVSAVPNPYALPFMGPVPMYGTQYCPPSAAYSSMDPLSQGLVESSFGIIQPHVVNSPASEVMVGRSDPMFSPGFEDQPRYYLQQHL